MKNSAGAQRSALMRGYMLIKIYNIIFKKRLALYDVGYSKAKIVKIRGIRTMLVDTYFGRQTITPLFKFFKWYI